MSDERLSDERVAEYAAMSEQEQGFHDFSGSTVYELACEVLERRSREPTFTSVVHDCCEDKQKLLAALREARDMVGDWASYAPEYFKEKHKLSRDLDELDAVIARYTE